MQGKDPKFLIGTKPVNRRTTPREPPSAAPTQLVARLQRRQVRQQWGAPLAVLLQRDAGGSARWSGRAIAATTGMAVAGLGLFLAWLQDSPQWASASALLFLAAVLVLWRERSRRPEARDALPSLYDPRHVASFDAAIGAVEDTLPELAPRLRDLKQALARISGLVSAGARLGSEDQLFLNECLRRYIPDTLEAYLAIPVAARTLTAAAPESPLQLAQQQLGLLQQELELREQQLLRDAAEALHRQQRFLQAKSSRRDSAAD
ncbi:MAG: hypothetical protein MUE46_11220 [Xanthomonadales bacterium]|jgi:hypothetical protein|nr:hypothetical protein [Xanthomonadales bacterium]